MRELMDGLETAGQKKARGLLRLRAKSNSWRRLEETEELYRTAAYSHTLFLKYQVCFSRISGNGILPGIP
jgi:hypothetical protein